MFWSIHLMMSSLQLSLRKWSALISCHLQSNILLSVADLTTKKSSFVWEFSFTNDAVFKCLIWKKSSMLILCQLQSQILMAVPEITCRKMVFFSAFMDSSKIYCFFCYLTMLYECFKLKDYWNLSVPVRYDSPAYLLTWEFGTFYLLIVELDRRLSSAFLTFISCLACHSCQIISEVCSIARLHCPFIVTGANFISVDLSLNLLRASN